MNKQQTANAWYGLRLVVEQLLEQVEAEGAELEGMFGRLTPQLFPKAVPKFDSSL
jgi:hypothetical protein